MSKLFSQFEADNIRQADRIMKEKQEEANHYMEKLVKGDIIADEKYERAKKEVNDAKAYMDKMSNKYHKIMKKQ